PSFLKVFTFPLVKGDPETALGNPDSLVITEAAARKYFGSEDPLGRTLRLANAYDFRVTGVARDIPANSHLRFDFLGNFRVLIKDLGYGTGWWNNDFYTYLRLAPNADFDKLAAAVEGYLTKVAPTRTRIRLQRLQDVHLRSSYAIDIDGASRDRSQVVAVFAGVAFLVLFIACINYMNLATARSGLRSKEVGLRKVVGAGRAEIMRQFFGESLLFAAVSSCAAAGLVSLLLPLFNSLTGKAFSPAILADPPVILFLAGVALVAGALSGIYPALFLSAFRPASIFRGESLTGARSALFRKSLVVLQFGLSIVFIAGTLVIAAQIRYMQTRDLGYDKDSLVYFPLRGELRQNYQAFKGELLRSAGILGVTSSSGVPTYTAQSTSAFDWEGRNPEERILVHHYSVDCDYFETLGMEMAKGRSFSREFPSDKDAYIVNETAARLMGYDEPLGKTVSLLSRPRGPIVGVVKDFNFKSLHVNVEPLVLRIEPARDNYVFVKTGFKNIAASLETIRRLHGKHNPGYPLEYEFLNEALGKLYASDRQFGAIIRIFTGLAIFVSCLGLFGLASFLIERRTREIGIRMILGADMGRIVVLLSKDFLKWVAVANVIAVPVAYYVMSRWLDNFAYRTGISVWIFVGAAGLALAISMLTISTHCVRAAASNPAESLRHE
ncbi:MAG: ABC transporter permease, partial [Candidatus Aminicenantes bacterium]|nr:ABC transporter permease [Candidatus Aminicenantes bacterium]